jgi:hypothetical protein
VTCNTIKAEFCIPNFSLLLGFTSEPTKQGSVFATVFRPTDELLVNDRPLDFGSAHTSFLAARDGAPVATVSIGGPKVHWPFEWSEDKVDGDPKVDKISAWGSATPQAAIRRAFGA